MLINSIINKLIKGCRTIIIYTIIIIYKIISLIIIINMIELMNIVMNIKSKITYMDITSCIRFKFMIIRLINIVLFIYKS